MLYSYCLDILQSLVGTQYLVGEPRGVGRNAKGVGVCVCARSLIKTVSLSLLAINTALLPFLGHRVYEVATRDRGTVCAIQALAGRAE